MNPASLPKMLAMKVIRWSASVSSVGTSQPLTSGAQLSFTPTQDLKDELADTAIQITCYDRNGDHVNGLTVDVEEHGTVAQSYVYQSLIVHKVFVSELSQQKERGN